MGKKILITASMVVYLTGVICALLWFKEPIKIFNESSNESELYSEQFTFERILINNLILTLTLILGSFFFGSLTFVNLFYNGLILGFVLSSTSSHDMISIAALLLPHGILEIPAIIIAGAAGFKIPYEVIRYLTGKKEQIITKEDIKEYLTLALISIILIVIAAWIEANITLRIAKALLS